MYPHTHAQWLWPSSLAAKGETVPKKCRWDMQMQTCFPTGAQCQLSLHLAASWANWALSCTPKSYGIGLSQVTRSLVLTLLRNNKGDWWEASSCRNVSINEWNELRALNMILELLCLHRISFKDSYSYPKRFGTCWIMFSVFSRDEWGDRGEIKCFLS